MPGTQHPVRLGGDGTSTIADFAPAELGCALRISDGAAAKLIGDALDLRHRLPMIWTAALAGQTPAYQARHIATATRHLTKDQAGFVDASIASALGAVSWNRLHTLLEAAIYAADPVGAEQRAALAAQERFVRLGRSTEHGLKLIIVRATAGDAIWFKAAIDRIADILSRQGDNDPVDIRRSKAIGILAQPAQALQLATPNSPKQSGAPPRTPVPRSLRSWVNHPPHSCRLLRVRSGQRDDEIGSWQALRDEHRIVLVSRTSPIVSLVVAHAVLLVAVGQPLQTHRVIHL
jgi:Domain of unknown function (DUF222)